MSKEEQYQKLCEINRVEGFDPAAFAVEYTDMNTGEVRKRLPVMIQMAWFRLKYPEGRIAVEVTPAKDCFVAKARVYPNYQDGPECYLAEATASRGSDPDHPSVSPREWAQTAAVGVAPAQRGFWPTVQRSGGGLLPKLPGGTDHRNAHLQTGGTGLQGGRTQLGGAAAPGHEHTLSHRQVQGQNLGGRAHPGSKSHLLGGQQVYRELPNFRSGQIAL